MRNPDAMAIDHDVIAKVGRVTGLIGPGLVGEVMLQIRGGSEAFNAYAVEPGAVIKPGTRVIVIEFEPPRTVRVEPF